MLKLPPNAHPMCMFTPIPMQQNPQFKEEDMKKCVVTLVSLRVGYIHHSRSHNASAHHSLIAAKSALIDVVVILAKGKGFLPLLLHAFELGDFSFLCMDSLLILSDQLVSGLELI